MVNECLLWTTPPSARKCHECGYGCSPRLAATAAYSQSADTSILKLPQDIVFKGPLGGAPQTAVLYGDPTKPGTYAKAIFWQAIVASAIRARTMPPTLQNTRAQRNAALARSSSSIGHVVNVRYWPIADVRSCTAHVRFWNKSGHVVLRCKCLLLTQSGHWRS